MGYIYLRTNRINGKKYVGLTTDLKTRQNRWNDLNQPYAGKAINRARAKYGIDSFSFEILKECDDKELDKWEIYYIKELNTKVPYGYNMTDGGGGTSGYTYSHSEETKKKMSEARKGILLSEETKKKMSKAQRGEKNYMYGKHHSDKTRKKMSEAQKGKHINGKCSKPVLQYDLNGNFVKEWPSTMEVQRQLGISNSHISNCCKGKKKTSGGFKWQYK